MSNETHYCKVFRFEVEIKLNIRRIIITEFACLSMWEDELLHCGQYQSAVYKMRW